MRASSRCGGGGRGGRGGRGGPSGIAIVRRLAVLILGCLLLAAPHDRARAAEAQAAQPAPSAQATLTTLDGRKLTGKVSAAGPRSLAVSAADAAGAPATVVALDDLATLTAADDDAEAKVRSPFASPLKSQDIGKPRSAGSYAADAAGGVHRFTCSGWGFWGPEDSGRFAYVPEPVAGDFQLIARVVSNGPDEAPCAAGVMARASLAPDALMAAAMLYPGGEVRFPHRPHRGYIDTKVPDPNRPPRFVRLAREGDAFSCWRSHDGRQWTLIDRRTIPMGEKVLVGLAAATQHNSFASSATIDSVGFNRLPARATFYPASPYPVEGVVLTDGTVLAGRPTRLAEQGLRLYRGRRLERDERPDPKTELTVPQELVARLLFNPAPADLESLLAGKPGLLLAGGDFAEGELRSLANGRLEVRSVLFGNKAYDAARSVVAAGLRPVGQARPATLAPWLVKLRDGSAVQACDVALGDAGDLLVTVPEVGTFAVPMPSLKSIARRR